jgi:HEAT repeat protein
MMHSVFSSGITFFQSSPAWICRLGLGSLLVLFVGCYQDVPSTPDRAVRMLTELLSDSHPSVRITAAEALGKIGPASAERVLVRALGDSDTGVREAAARALGRLPSFGAEAGARLTTLLKDSDPSVRQAAAQALDTADNVALLAPHLIDLLRDSRVEVRQSSGHALLLADPPGTIANQALVKATHDPDPSVRQWAVAALGESGATGSAPVLVDRLIHDPSEAVRAEAAYRLRYLGDESVASELEALGSREKSANVARWVAESVGGLRTETYSGSAHQPGP